MAVDDQSPRAWSEQYHTFRYPGCSINLDAATAEFTYELVGDASTVTFVETIEFPQPTELLRNTAQFTKIVELLYLVAGTSYYKTAAPAQIETPGLTDSVAAYLTQVYRCGLGEFAYRNNLPHILRTTFLAAESDPIRTEQKLHEGTKPLVPFGGGKDSIVSVELLRESGIEPVIFAVNPNKVLLRAIDATELPALQVRRNLDRKLIDLSKNGALNGHIPVTAINSLLALATSQLHGLGPVVMSNERSASSGNLVWEGEEINHQWSKGLDAEASLVAATHAQYFSLLRPLTELHIAQLFAKTSRYDHVVTSCNAVFRLEGAAEAWCRNCPKCAFVFLILAPFMPRERLLSIFGGDMLSDLSYLNGFRELVGLLGTKPWECVGEPDEALVALQLLRAHPQWQGAPVVLALSKEVAAWPSPNTAQAMFDIHAPHRIPDSMVKVLHALD